MTTTYDSCCVKVLTAASVLRHASCLARKYSPGNECWTASTKFGRLRWPWSSTILWHFLVILTMWGMPMPAKCIFEFATLSHGRCKQQWIAQVFSKGYSGTLLRHQSECPSQFYFVGQSCLGDNIPFRYPSILGFRIVLELHYGFKASCRRRRQPMCICPQMRHSWAECPVKWPYSLLVSIL